MFRVNDGPPSVTFNHQAACPHDVQLVYDCLRLKMEIQEKDRELFDPIIKPCRERRNFKTFDRRTQLKGFGSVGRECSGRIQREWSWISPNEAALAQVQGVTRPETEFVKSVNLVRDTKHISAMLLGIESSAPLKEDCFGEKHTPDATSKERSAFGKRKWADYGNRDQEVPAKKGGMRVTINDVQFEKLQEACRLINLCTPSQGYQHSPPQEMEKELFRKLLQDPTTISH